MSDPLSPYLNGEEFHNGRLHTLRGSDVKPLVKGDAAEIRRLWRIKTGRLVPDDNKRIAGDNPRSLENMLPALKGRALEDFNWRYYWKATGRRVWGQNTKIVHPEHPWIGASLDGISTTADGRECVLECKCVDPFKDIKRQYQLHSDEFYYLISYRKWEETVLLPLLIKEYTAQCHVAMACGGWEVATLSTIIGYRHFTHEIEFDPWLWLELFDLMERFWACVQEDRKPGEDVLKGLKA